MPTGTQSTAPRKRTGVPRAVVNADIRHCAVCGRAVAWFDRKLPEGRQLREVTDYNGSILKITSHEYRCIYHVGGAQ